MENIYPILAKHFLKEASLDEEKEVAKFKRTNSKEYAILRSLWNNRNISVHDFDSQKAWKAVIDQRDKRAVRVIPLFGKIRNIAAAVAFLIMGTFAVLYFTNILPKSDVVLVANTDSHILEQRLADGSVVWLNRGSSIEYPKEFKTDRDVSLHGEAFFEVAKDSVHPFVVTSDYSTVTVLGTSFNIDTNDQRTLISVQTGKVAVASTSSDEKVVLLQDQSALVSEKGLLNKNGVDPNYLSWKTGVFRFTDTPIAQVVAQLNTYYQDSLIIDSGKPFDCNLSAKFDQAPLDDIVEIIEATCGASIKKRGNGYLIGQ